MMVAASAQLMTVKIHPTSRADPDALGGWLSPRKLTVRGCCGSPAKHK